MVGRGGGRWRGGEGRGGEGRGEVVKVVGRGRRGGGVIMCDKVRHVCFRLMCTTN